MVGAVLCLAVALAVVCWLRWSRGGRDSVASFDARVMAGPMTWKYWRGECRELWDEVRVANWPAAREELSDVLLCGQCAAYHGMRKRISWPLFCGLFAARKFEARRTVWRGLFERHGLRFENRYLIGGGNYRRIEKVQAALALARADQGGGDV